MSFFHLFKQNNTVWQTLYVTPTQDNESVKLAQADIMAKLDKFADMTDHWAHYDVEFMANEGLVAGKGEGVFDPDAQITRAEYVTLLDRAMKYEVAAGETYPDVPADAWYAPYVAAGTKAGIINGITADTFGVGSEISRQDMAVMILRVLNLKNVEIAAKDGEFKDGGKIADYAKDSVYAVRNAGIINGYEDNTFAPNASLTRAEAATVIVKLLDLLK